MVVDSTAAGPPAARSSGNRIITAAHRSWRFGTKVRVTNLRNGRAVVVTITDRGPYVRGRGLDLSVGAARALNATGSGVVPVRLDPLCEESSPVKAQS